MLDEMIALLVIDMQDGSLADSDKHDVDGVVARINALAEKVRTNQGKVIFIQHDGTEAENLEPGTRGWQVLSSVSQHPADIYISKSTNDSFYGTSLQETLTDLGVTTLIVSGWATDQCVDSTIRAAISRDYDVIVASDCHTVSDRTITAKQVITHHNGIWEHLLTSDEPVKVMPARQIIQTLT